MHGKHKSLDKNLKKSIKWIYLQKSVKKIILGLSKNCRHRYKPGYIKFKNNVTAGIKVNGYSGKGITDIFIKINPIKDRNSLKKKIFKYFKKKCPESDLNRYEESLEGF